MQIIKKQKKTKRNFSENVSLIWFLLLKKMSCCAKKKINFDLKCNSCNNLYDLRDSRPLIIVPCVKHAFHFLIIHAFY